MPDVVLVKAFAQAHTVKGFRYLDEAGRVMNEYSGEFTDMNVGVAGLVMKGTTSPLDEARVSAQDIWAGFTRPATSQYVVDHADRFVRTVCGYLEVEAFKRLGLRLQYLIPQTQSPEMMRRLAPIVVGPGLTDLSEEPRSFDASMQYSAGEGRTVNLGIRPVHLADPTPDQTLPGEGLMLDADVSTEGEIPIGQLRAFLRESARWSEETLLALADRLDGGGDS